ncbi:MAG: hypothetical protein Ct9H300mP28_24530 [Pseudomonadota bacterium]|nr:MAG: hypothetical protein Ct9H300mP28_24530 [Pseudomonadota bacterium]
MWNLKQKNFLKFFSALEINGKGDSRLICEVQQHLGESRYEKYQWDQLTAFTAEWM